MIVIMLMVADLLSAQNTRYVTDELTFALRTGKSTTTQDNSYVAQWPSCNRTGGIR